MFDQTSAELKATMTMTKDGNFFWAISTNSFRFELSFKLLFMCNKLLHNIFLNKHSMHDIQSY